MKEPIDAYLELGAAVIKQAIYDLRFIDSKKADKARIGRDAYDFLSGKRLDKWCNVLGLDADFIRRKVNKTYDLTKKILITPKSLE